VSQDSSQTPELPDLKIGIAQRAARRYKDTPKLRAIVDGLSGWVPLLSGANTYFVERLSQLERERTEALFSYLDQSGAELTPELIASDDFLHCFTITVQAAQRTRRNGKIRLLARLLLAAGDGKSIADTDEYEELLATLDDMTNRELSILVTLERYEQTTAYAMLRQGDYEGAEEVEERRENDFQRAERFWPSFVQEAAESAGVRPEEMRSMMSRLNRTGLYQTFVGYWDMRQGSGYLTPRYYRLRQLIQDRDGNVITPDVNEADFTTASPPT